VNKDEQHSPRPKIEPWASWFKESAEPADEQSAGSIQTGQLSVDELELEEAQPNEEQPNEEQPNEGQPNEGQPNEDQPSDEQPVELFFGEALDTEFLDSKMQDAEFLEGIAQNIELQESKTKSAELQESTLQNAEPTIDCTHDAALEADDAHNSSQLLPLPLEESLEETTESALESADVHVPEAEYERALEQALKQSLEPAPDLPDDVDAAFARHFKPIPEAKLKKARRTKRSLITMITVLVLVLCGAATAGVYFYLHFAPSGTPLVQDPPLILETNGSQVDDRGITESVEMPHLASMFGKTPDEVLAVLGSDYSITKVDSGPTDQMASEDGFLPAIRQVVTISYTSSEEQNNLAALRQSQWIYLSLNEWGTTIEVYFVSSMDILDFPISSFSDLVATSDSFEKTLGLAGVMIAPEITYTVPSKEEFTEYVDPEASIKKVRKETTAWRGTLMSETTPTSFDITFTYDFGASGIEDTPDRHPIQRMLYLKLS